MTAETRSSFETGDKKSPVIFCSSARQRALYFAGTPNFHYTTPQHILSRVFCKKTTQKWIPKFVQYFT
jgi:hypothetical protein